MADYVRSPLHFTVTLEQRWTPTRSCVFDQTTEVDANKGSREERVAKVVAAMDTAYGLLKAEYLQDIQSKTWAP